MKDENKTSNEHFIPQFYQRYWECEAKGHIWMLDIKYLKIRKKAISTNCSIDNLYEGDINNPDNVFEKLYGEFENRISPKYKRFIEGCNCLQHIDEYNKKLIVRMFANISSRHGLNVYKNRQNNVISSMFTVGIEDKGIDQRVLQNLVALSQGGVIDADHSKLVEDLMAYDMQVLVLNKPDIIFSDCLVHQMFSKEELFFPLCPTMVAYLTKNKKDVNGQIRRITSDEYIRYIRYIVNNSFATRLYASNKNVLEEIKEKFYKR